MHILDEKWLAGWQDEALERGRRMLKLKKRIYPAMAEVLAVKGLVDRSLYPMMRPIDNGGRKPDALPDDQLVLMVLPATQFWDDEACLTAIRDVVVTPETRPKFESFVALASALGKGVHENPIAVVKKVALEQFGLHEKDVWAAWFKDFLKRSQAFAYLKLDEGYVLNAHGSPEESEEDIRSRYPDDLSDCEAASEVVMCSMESKLFARMLTLPFERTIRNKGRVKKWGDIHVLDSRTNGTMSGRFMNLLARDADVPKETRV